MLDIRAKSLILTGKYPKLLFLLGFLN